MKIAILGYGSQGQSAYEYWGRDGHDITICDLNPNTAVPDGVKSQLGPEYLDGLDRFDLIIRTPILHPKDIITANSKEILDKVTTNTNEFFRVCPTKNIIGVTGTKGKGTTATLIAKILEASGKTVHLGGNIGIPPLELLNDNIQPDDWVVLELANFQLIDLKYSPAIAVCLMVVPEHLDWHEDFDEYITAKQQMFIHQKEADKAIYYARNDNSIAVADASIGQQIPYMQSPGAEVIDGKIMIAGQEICQTSDLKLLGKHNWQNVCAAITTVWFSLSSTLRDEPIGSDSNESKVEGQITQDIDAIRSAVTAFKGLPFRIELRREVKGVEFYNDSFATGPGACLAAIEAITKSKVMIIGGYDRGLELSELAEGLIRNRSTIKTVILIGASAKRTAAVLKNAGFENYVLCEAKNMDEIVQFAYQSARSGDAVVLSPAFASFDMFKNFEERGLKFNEAVENL